MIKDNLLQKIDSDTAAELFSELYGRPEIDAARQRYKSLITEILKDLADSPDGFPNAGRCEAEGKLWLFSAPGRTELAGNHTDHNRGKVLAASVHLDSAAVVRERGDNTVFFRSAGFPDVIVRLADSAGAFDLRPKPEEVGTTEALIRGTAAELNLRGCTAGGFSANAASTVFPGSGLSSSAALEVLLGRVFDSLYGGGKRGFLEIAQIGQTAENAYFGKPCGLMDQIACAAGGAVAIDFSGMASPEVKQIHFNPAAAGYALCVVNTGGSHADLTADYASIPAEMKSVANFFGKSVLGELEKETVMDSAVEVRKTFGDRALLRSLHFFDENKRVDAMAAALTQMENAVTSAAVQHTFSIFLDMVNESGDSSWEFLQNVYSPNCPEIQGIGVALALTKDFFRKRELHSACRVHGGGFAGTIQAYIPLDALSAYRTQIEAVFGADSVTVLRIRPRGAIELIL
ncbi:MAG: galactokinase [Treponema sp.]|jgi:galactokinase|nr:galactokinase [Treponema sp.]